MNRRKALAAALGPLLAGCAGPSSRRDGIEADGSALLNRLSWGATPSSRAGLARQGTRDFIEAQLQPDPSAQLPPAMQAQIDAMTISRTPTDTLVTAMVQQRRDADALADDEAKQAARKAWQQEMTRLAREAASRSLLRAVAAAQQLQERMTWFWANHFSVYDGKHELRAMVGDYEERTLRPRALGKFRDLLIASATHPAMLRYLDNDQNAAKRPNENFARELMELHTLGVDGGYSQQDVQELARVLSGLGVNLNGTTPSLRPPLAALYLRRGLTEFNPARHDRGAKIVLGHAVAADGGWDEIIDQLTRLAREPATAHHLSRQLAMYFVADDPPPALVERIGRRFIASDGDIALCLQALFDAPEFRQSLGQRFKDPMQYVLSAVRLASEGQPTLDPAPMLGWLNRLGEAPFRRQTPDGYPLAASAWSGSGQMSTRFEIARAIAGGRSGLLPADTARARFASDSAGSLGAPTRSALDAAASPQDWNALLLSSPEFMRC